VEIEETEDLKMEPPDGDPPSAECVKRYQENWNRRMEAAKLMADGSLNVSIAPLKPLKRFRIPQKKVMSDERLGASGSEVDTNAAQDLFPPNPSSATDFISSYIRRARELRHAQQSQDLQAAVSKTSIANSFACDVHPQLPN
jgi:hypothetical protein